MFEKESGFITWNVTWKELGDLANPSIMWYFPWFICVEKTLHIFLSQFYKVLWWADQFNRQCQEAQLVEYLSFNQGALVQITVGLFLYFSHPVTCGAMPTPGTDRLTSTRVMNLGMSIFKGHDHLREKNITVRLVPILEPESSAQSVIISPILLQF